MPRFALIPAASPDTPEEMGISPTTVAALLALTFSVSACSSSDEGTAAGNGNSGGVASGDGGAASGGSSNTGGSTAGAQGTGGRANSSGGASSSGGAVTSGGASSGGASPGGASGSGGSAGGPARSCADPDPNWLYCEDFERGAGDFDAFLAGSQFLDSPGSNDRGRITLASDQVHSGSWAVFLPAAASSGYQGASLDWYACDGASRTNCPLRSFDSLYFRVWVRFAPDHRYIHHFLSISGSQPNDFWYHGSAGCMPNGTMEMGTTVDYHEDTHESFFYTYYPGMACDTACDRYADVASICADCASKGLPTCDVQPQCCWGANMEPPTPQPYPIGEWFCLELTMTANTPSASDGEQTYWINGQLGHHVDGMNWRTTSALALNRARLAHYIETSDAGGHSNQVWFDDMVVSTQRIGCQ